jgi:exodeoxyribonuclease VIII
VQNQQSAEHGLVQMDGPVLKSDLMTELHMMVDLETMDVENTASILSIGAVMFNPFNLDTEDSLTDSFYLRISLESNMKAGRTTSASTICWWLTQSEDARTELVEGEQLNIGMGMLNFRRWITDRSARATKVWAKDPDFDCSILKHAMAQQNEFWPFHFADNMSVRTETWSAYPEGDAPLIGVGTAHNALDDAKRQALMMQHCINKRHPRGT